MNENKDSNEAIELNDAIESGHLIDVDKVIENDDTVYAVVKMKLNTLCKNNDLSKKLQFTVSDMNRLVAEAYAFSNFHILRILEDPSIQVPKMDRGFFYRCIAAVGELKCNKGTLNDDFKMSIALFDSLRPIRMIKGKLQKVPKVRILPEYNQLIADTSITMATMATNHLWTNLESRLKRYLSLMHPSLKRYHKSIIDSLINFPKAPIRENIIKSNNKPRRTKEDIEAEKLEKAAMKKAKEDEKLAKIAGKMSKPKNNVRKTKAEIEAERLKTKANNDLKKLKEDAKEKKKNEKLEEAKRKEIIQLEKVIGIANELRDLVKLPSKAQFASRAHLTLPLYHRMLKDTEREMELFNTARNLLPHDDPKKKKHFQGRLFTLLPIKSGFVCSHIPVSSMLLLGILKKMNLSTFEGDGRDEDPLQYWKKFFNLNIIETKNRKFANRIVTDGYAVGALMNVRVSLNTSKNRNDSTVDEIQEAILQIEKENGIYVHTGIDPGFSDVVTGARETGGESGEKKEKQFFHYSSRQYYEESKVNYSRHRTTKWNKQTREFSNKLGYNGGMTTSQETMNQYIENYLDVLRELLYHREARGFRKLRFLRYIYKYKTIKKICDMIAPDKKTTYFVGFGDWSGGHKSCISRKAAGPIQDIKRELRRRSNVYLKHVDEHLTSQTDSDTHLRLSNMRANKTIKLKNGTRKTLKNQKVHKVLHCKTSDGRCPKGCQETTWNRDINASINILELFKLEIAGEERPQVFRRSANTKIIKEAV
jgi:hypothetical protein